MTAICANTEALNRHLNGIDRADRLQDEAEEELRQALDPIVKDLQEVLSHHVRCNDANMDHNDTRNFILMELGELL